MAITCFSGVQHFFFFLKMLILAYINCLQHKLSKDVTKTETKQKQRPTIGRCRGVKIPVRVNVWTVCQDQKK